MSFEIPSDTGSAMVHGVWYVFITSNFQNPILGIFVSKIDVVFSLITGFAGYFDATLYKDVHLGIEPSTATPNMFSWYWKIFCLLCSMFRSNYIGVAKRKEKYERIIYPPKEDT